MCCFEVGLNMFSTVLAVNFGFLYTLSGRLIFLLFVGFMSFSLSTFGIAAMAYLYLVGAVHIGIMVYFPKYSEYVRQKDYYGKNMVRSVVHPHPLQPLPFSPRSFTLPMHMPRCLCQDSLTTHVPLFRAFLSHLTPPPPPGRHRTLDGELKTQESGRGVCWTVSVRSFDVVFVFVYKRSRIYHNQNTSRRYFQCGGRIATI
jgi:hypothetical protein